MLSEAIATVLLFKGKQKPPSPEEKSGFVKVFEESIRHDHVEFQKELTCPI